MQEMLQHLLTAISIQLSLCNSKSAAEALSLTLAELLRVLNSILYIVHHCSIFVKCIFIIMMQELLQRLLTSIRKAVIHSKSAAEALALTPAELLESENGQRWRSLQV